MAMCKFGFAKHIAHQYGKCSMGRYGCKHAYYAGSYTILKYVKHIFQRGEAHAYHHGIHNAIKRFVEVFIVIENESDKNKFAELFDERNFKEGVAELMQHIIFFKTY